MLKGVEASKMFSNEEPFTPRRSVHSAHAPGTASMQSKKASAEETGLLKTIGITPAALEVDDLAFVKVSCFVRLSATGTETASDRVDLCKVVPLGEQMEQAHQTSISVTA